ncbi:SLOG family protein [Bacillus inaquosorum]|uniref:SLOG family protein n=1 Tax=Bacillus inaquosorum TaxID=483913 RepID=UPI0022808354|nr:SLOG family protein [Bacillus inaquosorum]MCY9308781.1 SLOG family protein [Bacillus inaquosorum]
MTHNTPKTKEITISLTGSRPSKLGGYDYYSPLNIAIANKLRDYLLSYLKAGMRVHAISGMALGADTIFALVVLKLKRQGYDIALEAAIPCANHSIKWPEKSQEQWQSIIDQSDKVTYVSNQLYSPYLMQKRNEYMVNQCDVLIAVWDGHTTGGTYNCVQYAKKKEVGIVFVNPNELIVEMTGDLLKSNCDVIMHQANCQSTMGSGIAKQIRNTFPKAYEVDRQSSLSPLQKLGGYTFAEVQNGTKQVEVVNLYGQLNYGSDFKQYTDYEALKNAICSYLKNRKDRKDDLQTIKIGVPKYMGCVRAGGDWNVVKALLESICRDFHICIYTYEFK